MARLTFPDEGSRLVFRLSGANKPLLSAAGGIATVYADAAGTTVADIQTTDGDSITGARLTIDGQSRLPLFLGPDGEDIVWVSVDGGVLAPVYARGDDRLDTLGATVAAVTLGTVRSVNSVAPDGSGNVVLASGAVADATAIAKGVVQLAGDLAGTAAAPTVPGVVRTTGAQVVAGVKTFTDKPTVPDDSFTLAKVIATGTRDATTFLRGDGAFAVPAGGTASFPLGCAEEPITDYRLVRPTVPFSVVHWEVPLSPPNAAKRDRIEIIPTLHVQHWDGSNGTGIANWRAKSVGGATRASALVNDTTAARDAGGGTTPGSLRWTNNAAGDSAVESTDVYATTASTSVTYDAFLYNGDTIARNASLVVNQFTSADVYIAGGDVVGAAVTIPAGTLQRVILPFTTAATAAKLRLSAQFVGGALNATFNIDQAVVYAP